MSATKPCGTFPTSYGVWVPLFRPRNIDPADPEAFAFDMEGTALCAGIHDPAERKRFAADSHRLGHMPDLQQYGGHPVPHVALPKPKDPAYPRLLAIGATTPVEAWTTGVMDRFRWCERADFLVDIIGENMSQIEDDTSLVGEVYPLGIAVLLTAALEHLCEPEIDCIEAAAFYALTEHAEWREPAIAWLEPFRQTWFADWCDARPAYARVARSLAKAWGLPDWLGPAGGAA